MAIKPDKGSKFYWVACARAEKKYNFSTICTHPIVFQANKMGRQTKKSSLSRTKKQQKERRTVPPIRRIPLRHAEGKLSFRLHPTHRPSTVRYLRVKVRSVGLRSRAYTFFLTSASLFYREVKPFLSWSKTSPKSFARWIPWIFSKTSQLKPWIFSNLGRLIPWIFQKGLDLTQTYSDRRVLF